MKMRQDELDPIVKRIAKANTRPLIDMSIRDIQAEVYHMTGYTPSTSVVAASLDRIKATARGHRWAWLHNGGRHE